MPSGFDRLIALGPQEIQVGILKRLRGTPIVRHDAEWQMMYNPHPPYEILQNRLIDFATMQRLRRFARYWDLVGNSGNFVESTPLIWGENVSPVGRASPRAESSSQDRRAGSLAPPPAFAGFLRFSDWLHGRTGRTDSIALVRLMELLFEFLTGELKLDAKLVAETNVARLPAGRPPRQANFPEGFSVPGRKSGPAAQNQNDPAQTPGAASGLKLISAQSHPRSL